MSTLRVDNLNARTGTTISVPSGTKLYLPGHIIQAQSTTKTDSWSASIAYGTWTDIPNLSVSITPTSSSSKMLFSGHMYGNGQTNYTQFYFRLVRNSTAIAIADASSSRPQATGRSYYGSADIIAGAMSFQHLDSPATTSSITYKVQATTQGSTYTLYLNRTQNDNDGAGADGVRVVSSITVMEIAQ